MNVPDCTSAFDGLARAYDAQFTATALGALLRRITWRNFERVFAQRESLLEIGCGTGEDAIHLASLGHRVVASDASLPMIRMASRKAEQAGCAQRIRFLWAPMERLGTELAGERFDGVYSNFGAMNCASSIDTLARDLASLLPAGAPLAWVLMGRYVPWEWAWYLARGEPGTAFRRLRRGGVPWRGLTVRYPTPARLARTLQPFFTACRATPLGLALPGSYAAACLQRAPRLLAALAGVDGALQRLPLLAACADHYCLEARRA
jgi:SAM-dependent methyltransferase